MSQQSFAAVSIAGAIVWGAFFYPPPAERPDAGTAPAGAPAVDPGAAPEPETTLPLSAAATGNIGPSGPLEGAPPPPSAEPTTLAPG